MIQTEDYFSFTLKNMNSHKDEFAFEPQNKA
jgi:hypothetical protein